MCTLADFLKGNKIQNLFLGNGFCRQISDRFCWRSIVDGCDEITKLQKKYKNDNLELLFEKCDEREKKIIKENFIKFFRKNHPHHIDNYNFKNRKCLISTLKQLKTIFTTNYDLSLYWILVKEMCKNHFCDGFYGGKQLKFDQVRFNQETGIPIFYVHGALLIYHENNKEFKIRTETSATIIHQVKNNNHIPVYVFESKHNKRDQIEKFDYLKYCFKKLGEIKGNICIFGSNINERDPIDVHMRDQILKNQSIDQIYLGIYSGNDEIIFPDHLKKWSDRVIPFSTKEYTFNDCSTH